MKHTTISQQAVIGAADLRNALAFVSSAIERRATIPILAKCRLTADVDVGVTVAGTDLDAEAKSVVEAEVEGGFDTTVDPRTLTDLLSYAEGLVTIVRTGELVTFTVDDMTAEFREVCPAADWPEMTIEPDGAGTVIPEGALLKALHAVEHCASTEQSRYYLEGVYVHAVEGLLTTAATDGRRLAKYASDEPWALANVILRSRTIKLLCSRLHKGGNNPVHVTADKRSDRLCFTGFGWSITCRPIDGTFPDYTRVIPERSDDITVTLSAAALRRIPKPRHGWSQMVTIEPDKGMMSVDDQVADATFSMKVQGRGERFGFNLGYLRTFANRAGTIRISAKRERDPAHILTDDPRLTQVLMPMRCEPKQPTRRT